MSETTVGDLDGATTGSTPDRDADRTRVPAIAAAVVIALVVGAAGVLGWFIIEPPPPTLPPGSRSAAAGISVPVASNGGVTDPVLGVWSATDGTLRVDQLPASTEGDSEAMAVALAPLETTNGFVLAKANPVAPGWGLVFRWSDADNHGWVRVAPVYAAIKVGVTVGGVSTDLATFAPVAVEGSTVEVDVVDDEVLVWTNGKLAGRVKGAPTELGTGWGIMGDSRVVGIAGWAGARAGVLADNWPPEASETLDGGDGANR